MQTARKWTVQEVNAFGEWNDKRKNGQLGAPMHFKTVDDLVSWLNARIRLSGDSRI
jgi:hypothetical protein